MKTKFGVNKEKLESTMEREFDAPRELLWKAHTDRDLIAKWWGPRKYETTVEKFDATPGGEWKMVHKANGEEHVFYGEFKELKEPEKIVWTFIYAPYPDSVLVETLKLEALPDGKTKISTVSKYPNLQALEGMLQSGMEEGANESWDRLEELASSMKS
jgi:uncharacterized protein YndB with AHSA1/START domain